MNRTGKHSSSPIRNHLRDEAAIAFGFGEDPAKGPEADHRYALCNADRALRVFASTRKPIPTPN